jgi:hypothetical protein
MKATVMLPERDGETGHRVASKPGWVPVGTRYLPWPVKLAEYPCRILARYAYRHAIVWEVPDNDY